MPCSGHDLPVCTALALLLSDVAALIVFLPALSLMSLRALELRLFAFLRNCPKHDPSQYMFPSLGMPSGPKDVVGHFSLMDGLRA